MTTAKSALTSLWGRGGPTETGGDKARMDALGGAVGGVDRETRIYTPQSVVDALLRFWPEGIALDPCSGPGSLVPAAARACPDDPTADHRDGLSIAWPPRTYCNPPYSDLRTWLTHASRYDEIVCLVPARSHRWWWRRAMRERADAVCELDPLQFVGFPQSFPAPLVASYWGDAARVGAFADAFAGLGETYGIDGTGARPRQRLLWGGA